MNSPNNSKIICAILLISYLIFYTKMVYGLCKPSFSREGVQTSGLPVLEVLMTIFFLNAAS